MIAKTHGAANPANMITRDGCRVTVITDRLFRVESSKTGVFEDSATQCFWFRDAGDVPFTVKDTKKHLLISTAKAELAVSKKSRKAVSVKFPGTGKTVKCANRGNLKGTKRTLDMSVGRVRLGDGLVSKSGVAVVDDSGSLLVTENGEIQPRKNREKDTYIFAYANAYRDCLRDFFRLSGKAPLIPRFALGVWWSRYKAYTQREYLELIQRFEDENIPLTVATVDMDWHWTDLNAEFGTRYRKKPFVGNLCTGGWTGYSWNTRLFPDYKEFLRKLHEKNLKVTLNLHPADGIRFFETMYEEACAALGMDPAEKRDIPFRLGDSRFWNTYFDVLHKPYEKDGVDFWWIDWQQGKRLDVEGLDPLWALNHYHFLDNAEDGRLPLILSRFAGLGSHRYPLGFSGDTTIFWSVLRFQPYFTATAANAGYTWWSHDIGGHTMGRRDDELYLRWLQYGVFSPVTRLHSTASDLLGKEPWRYPGEIAAVAADWLRFRHKLIPYLYTINYRTHSEGRPLVEPVYYAYADKPDSYKIKNEYLFGENILVVPITARTEKRLGLARVRAWVPEGRWTDIFTGETFNREGFYTLYRDITTIPVLARAGCILPLSGDTGNSCGNPRDLILWVFRGNGEFRLYEDDGTADYPTNRAITVFRVEENETVSLTVAPPEGQAQTLPPVRNYTVVFKDIAKGAAYRVSVDGETTECYEPEGEPLSEKPLEVKVDGVKTGSAIRIDVAALQPRPGAALPEQISDIFSRWRGLNTVKSILYNKLRGAAGPFAYRRRIRLTVLPRGVKKALVEYCRRAESE